MIRIGSKKLYMVWTTTCVVAAVIVYSSLRFADSEGTILQVFGRRIALGFHAREMAAETMGRALHTLVSAVIVCSGFSGLVDGRNPEPRDERSWMYLMRLSAAVAQGILLSLLAALPLMAAMIRLAGAGPGAQGHRAWLSAGTSGVWMGLQLLLWSGALLWLVRSNRWLAVLGAFGASYFGRLCGWVNEWGPDLGMSGIVLKISSALAICLPREFIPDEHVVWRQLILAAAIPLVLNLILHAVAGRSVRKLS